VTAAIARYDGCEVIPRSESGAFRNQALRPRERDDAGQALSLSDRVFPARAGEAIGLTSGVVCHGLTRWPDTLNQTGLEQLLDRAYNVPGGSCTSPFVRDSTSCMMA
jgi:hypothetical protein